MSDGRRAHRMGKRSYREWEGGLRHMKKWHARKGSPRPREQPAPATELVCFWLCVLLGLVWVFVCPNLR